MTTRDSTCPRRRVNVHASTAPSFRGASKMRTRNLEIPGSMPSGYASRGPGGTAPKDDGEIEIDRDGLPPHLPRRARRRFRFRPRRFRHRADGIRYLALRAAAVDGGAAGAGLFGDRANLDAAVDLENPRLQADLA